MRRWWGAKKDGAENEPSAEVEGSAEAEPSAEPAGADVESAREPQASQQAGAEPEPEPGAEPSIEVEPTVETAPIAETEPRAETASSSVPEPDTQAPPNVEAAEPIADQPTVETVPNAEAESTLVMKRALGSRLMAPWLWLAAMSRRPGVRVGVHGLAIVAVIGAAAYTGLYVVPTGATGSTAAPNTSPAPSKSAAPGLGAPEPDASAAPAPSSSGSPGPDRLGRRPQDALAGWASKMQHLGIPQVALQAYGYAEVSLSQTQPDCKLTWTTLAGIGSIESNHGQSGGAQLQQNGTSNPPVIGLPLDGGPDRKEIPDTDNGEFDGDNTYDRAVGAMQFIPETWQRWATDADGDGKTDPFDIDDAALAAARYLCAGGRDLSTAEGWSGAIFSYNHMDSYVRAVFAAADQYGRMSRAGG